MPIISDRQKVDYDLVRALQTLAIDHDLLASIFMLNITKKPSIFPVAQASQASQASQAPQASQEHHESIGTDKPLQSALSDSLAPPLRSAKKKIRPTIIGFFGEEPKNSGTSVAAEPSSLSQAQSMKKESIYYTVEDLQALQKEQQRAEQERLEDLLSHGRPQQLK